MTEQTDLLCFFLLFKEHLPPPFPRLPYTSLACQYINIIMTFVKAIDLTISSSVWPTFHPSSRHLRCGTTLSVVSTRTPLLTQLRSPCSVPVRRPVLITCTTPVSLVLYLQCTCCLPAYRYLIAQFPNSRNNYANLCELEVYVRRKSFQLVTCNVNKQADTWNCQRV